MGTGGGMDPIGTAGTGGITAATPLRVFLSHTSDLGTPNVKGVLRGRCGATYRSGGKARRVGIRRGAREAGPAAAGHRPGGEHGWPRQASRRAKEIELDPPLYAGHSLRAGHVNSADAAGAPESATTAQTGHRSADSLRGSVRHGSLFRQNSAACLGL